MILFFFLILGGAAKSLPELFFVFPRFFSSFWCFLNVFFIIYAYLSVFFGVDCGIDAFIIYYLKCWGTSKPRPHGHPFCSIIGYAST